MLTRKQMWRRVRQGGARFAEPTTTTTPAPPPPRRTRSEDAALCAVRPSQAAAPIDSLSIGDSLLHLLGTTSSSPGNEKEHENADDEEAVSPKTVSFKSQVRVVLVPCRRELHSLNAQLWWGADDYVDFRREYILAVREAAAASQAQRDNEQQQRPSHPTDRADAAAVEAREDDVDSPPPPPTPPCPPSPLSPASLSTPLPPTNAEAAAAAAKASVGTSSGQQRQHEQGGGRGVDGVRLATSISSEALTAAAAAAAAAPPLSKERNGVVTEEETEEKEPTPSRPPCAMARSSCVRASTSTKWTPFAGAAAAKAAAEEHEENGYRTMSMSSVSDNAFGGCHSDSNSDDEGACENGDDGNGYESDREDDGHALDGSGNKRLAAAAAGGGVRSPRRREEEQNGLVRGRSLK